MRIAVPVRGEQFCEHFGRSDGFFVCDVEDSSCAISRSRFVMRPRAKCESLPQWLSDLRVNAVLVGGIGPVGRKNLEARGIEVIAGYKADDPRHVLGAYLTGSDGGQNPCAEFEHRHHHCRKPRP